MEEHIFIMEFLANIGNWVIHTILKPVFGEWWAEITFLILFVIFCTLTILMIVFIVKAYKSNKEVEGLKEETDCLRKQCDCYEIERGDLKSKLSIEYNKFAELEADYTAETLAKKAAISEKKTLQKELNLLKEENQNLINEIEEMRLAKKRSDAARKGVATKRKKAQEQLQAQKQEDQPTTDESEQSAEV